MDSRLNKYSDNKNMSRVTRNMDLYKEINNYCYNIMAFKLSMSCNGSSIKNFYKPTHTMLVKIFNWNLPART